MEKKITKREMFTKVMEIAEVQANPEMVAFLAHEIELLDKKSDKKKSAFETEEGKLLIASTLEFVASASEPVTCSAVAKALDLSTQKMSPILTKLVEGGKLAKVKQGKSFVYTVA